MSTLVLTQHGNIPANKYRAGTIIAVLAEGPRLRQWSLEAGNGAGSAKKRGVTATIQLQ